MDVKETIGSIFLYILKLDYDGFNADTPLSMQLSIYLYMYLSLYNLYNLYIQLSIIYLAWLLGILCWSTFKLNRMNLSSFLIFQWFP